MLADKWPFAGCRALTPPIVGRVFVLLGLVHSAVGASQRLVSRPAVPGAPAGVTAFVRVAVIPMDTERVLLDQTVLVERGRITAIGPSRRIPVPSRAVRIDGRGKYLIPGLADMHTHVNSGPMLGIPLPAVPPDTLIAWRLFQLLADGVTSIRNLDYADTGVMILGDLGLGGMLALADGPAMVRLRDRAARGEFWSPRMHVAGQWGPLHYISSGLPVRRWSMSPQWQASPRDPGRPSDTMAPALRLDSIAAYLTAYKAAGYDVVKVHNESPEVFDAVLAAARRVGIPVVGHVVGPLERALAGGMQSIEHLIGYEPLIGQPDSAIAAAAAATARAGTWNCLTLRAGGNQPQIIRALQDAGAGLLLGVDEPIGSGVHDELQALVAHGKLTPYEALATGTRNVAAYFHTLDEEGTIAVGKRADLLLLNGNPLEGIRQTANPAIVMIGGRWLDRAALDRRLAAIAAGGGTGRPLHNVDQDCGACLEAAWERVRQQRAAATPRDTVAPQP